MGVPLTREESNRLHALRCKSEARSYAHVTPIDRDRNQKILTMLRAGVSTAEIKRKLHTGHATINDVKRKNGLWGA